jgi:hypothetical protein
MGENLPFSLARADERLTPVAKGLSAAVGDAVLQHVHVTTCGYTTSPPLLCALMVFGADRMLLRHPSRHGAESAFLVLNQIGLPVVRAECLTMAFPGAAAINDSLRLDDKPIRRFVCPGE